MWPETSEPDFLNFPLAVGPWRRRETSGQQRFVLAIGPSSITIEGQIEPGQWLRGAAHSRFLCPVAQPDLTLTVRYGRTAAPSGEPAFRLGDLASLYQDGAEWIIRLGEDDSSVPVDRVVTLDPSGNTGSLAMDVDQFPSLATSYPLEYPLEDILFRHLLANRRALMVHACGIAWRGQGYLFVGSSGAGKSTAARLWKEAGATVLNDDRVVLEASRAGIFIHPTPWSGDYREINGQTVPLAALYLLRKGPDVGLEPLRPAGAAALLLAKSFPPLWDPERMGRTLETLHVVCQHVPCGWLTVPPDQRAVAWVQAHR